MTPDMTNAMNCTEFEAAIVDLMDGSLDSATRDRMDAHKLDCADCAALLADLTGIRADAGKLPTLSPSHDLWSGIEARIEAPVVQLPVVHTEAPLRCSTGTPFQLSLPGVPVASLCP